MWEALPGPARGHIDLARIGLGPGDEFGNGLGRIIEIHQHDQRQAADHRDRNDVVDEVEAEVLVERGIGGDRLRDQ